MDHSHHSPSPSTDGSSMDHSMSMQMYFYWSNSVVLLFSGWDVSSTGAYIGSLIAIFAFCILHELLTTLRVIHAATISSIKAEEGGTVEHPLLQKILGHVTWQKKIVSSLLYGLNAGSGYLIMLLIMTFNGGVFIAIIAGLTSGYFIFGHGRYLPFVSTDGDFCHQT